MAAETLKRAELAPLRRAGGTRSTQHSTVRSIQRLPSMPDEDAPFIAREYTRWLPKFFRAFIGVDRDNHSARVTFKLSVVNMPLLVLDLVHEEGEDAREKFHIVGGVLSKTTNTGWLEFRQIANRHYTLAAVHGFVPALPWLIYIASQAPVHAWAMHAFGRHLERLKLRQKHA